MFVLDKNNTNSEGVSARTLSLSPINFPLDWAVDEESGTSCTVSRITADLDKPETIKFATSKLNNIYSNSDIATAERCPVTSGTRISASLHNTWIETDADTNVSYKAPVAVSIAVTVPNWGVISGSDVLSLISDVIGSLFDTDDTTSKCLRIERLLHGAEKPKGV